MKAIMLGAFGGPEVLTLTDVNCPRPLPTEVLIRVHAAGVNPVDLGVRSGSSAEFLGVRPPLIAGWDVSGVVEAIGAGVTRFAVGDEVFGMPWFPRPAGSFAQFVTAPARQLVRKPTAVDHVTAAAVPLAGLTAWQALIDTADVRPGQRVLVHAAAGGVGHLAVQIAKARGAYVLGTARAAKHRLLHEFGVDEAIDYEKQDFATTVRDVDIVVDLVGGDYLRRSLACLRPGGVLVEIAGDVEPDDATEAARLGVRAIEMLVEPDGVGMAALAELMETGQLRVEVSATYPLVDVVRAQSHLEDRRATGKIVLVVE